VQLLMVEMAVMTQLLLPQSPESCPALWQEEKQCINSAPEWVCKLTLITVCSCDVPDLPVADQKMLLNYCTVFIKSLKWLCAKKLPGLFLCNL
jgi:type IV secretory pathway TrbF-like protein